MNDRIPVKSMPVSFPGIDSFFSFLKISSFSFCVLDSLLASFVMSNKNSFGSWIGITGFLPNCASGFCPFGYGISTTLSIFSVFLGCSGDAIRDWLSFGSREYGLSDIWERSVEVWMIVGCLTTLGGSFCRASNRILTISAWSIEAKLSFTGSSLPDSSER